MKKILVALFAGIFLLSCSSINISTSSIKNSLSKRFDGEQNFYIFKAETKVTRVFVENKKLNIEVGLKLKKLDEPILALIETELKYYPPKLYATNANIRSISNAKYEKVMKDIFSIIVNTILINKEILNVGETINPDKIKNIYVGDNAIVVEFK
ncbi:hypothetical protein [Streptobacillus moniliformis]|uniref:hypothetical protein n=1 Tax=Streptobacillus moniliformis TaxID=34105 RepID=UPI0007E4D827|nr:hypothetical protein [Streptobacillus moniliformis]